MNTTVAIDVSAIQRVAWARILDTRRSRHAKMLATLTALNVTPPMTVYDPRSELAWHLETDIAYLRDVMAAFKPVLELICEDARSYCGAKVESADLLDAAMTDITAGMVNAVEELRERFEP